MNNNISRRHFIRTTSVGIATFTIGRDGFAANEKLSHACIGVGGMGWNDLNNFKSHPKVEIAAICDVDSAHLDKAAALLPNARRYRDWRELLAKEGDKMASLVPEAKDYKLVYALNPVNPQMASPEKILYQTDKRQEITGEIIKIAYYLELTKADGGTDYVFVSMDPFTKDIGKIGVPDLDSKANFQQKLSNVFVKSNVAGVKNGTFAEGCNIEFWGTNYGADNSATVPGASGELFDFGDSPAKDNNYGSMQIHNYAEKQTIFAFNHWLVGPSADLGIGNSSGPQPDWTFLANAGKYAGGKLLVLVQTK